MQNSITQKKKTGSIPYQQMHTFLAAFVSVCVIPYHMSVDMSNPTPIQSMKTTHSNSFNVSTKPISRTRPKPTVDTAEKT